MYKLAFCMEKRWNRAFWWVWSLKNMLQGPGCAFLRIVLLFIWNFICTPDNNTCAKKMVDYAVDGFWLAAPVWAMMPWMRRRRTGGVLMESGDKKTTRDFYKTSLEMKYLPYQRVQDLFQQYMGTIFATFFLADLCHSNRTCFGKTCPPAWNL